MHPLDAYLKSNRIQQQELAELSGVSESTISKVVNGKKHGFGGRDAVRVFNAIQGAVGLAELMLGVADMASVKTPRKLKKLKRAAGG